MCRNQLSICFQLYLFPCYSNRCLDSTIGTLRPFEKVVESFRYQSFYHSIHSTTFLPLCSLQILFTLVHFLYFSSIWKLQSAQNPFLQNISMTRQDLWILESFLTSIHWRSLCIYVEGMRIFSVSLGRQSIPDCFFPFSFLQGMA